MKKRTKDIIFIVIAMIIIVGFLIAVVFEGSRSNKTKSDSGQAVKAEQTITPAAIDGNVTGEDNPVSFDELQ